MIDDPTRSDTEQPREEKRALSPKRVKTAIFADQIVETREAIAKARELLKPVSRPRRPEDAG